MSPTPFRAPAFSLLTLLVFSCAAAFSQDKVDSAAELEKAHALLVKSQNDPDGSKARAEFHAVLQKLAGSLPEVPAEKDFAKKYTKVTLNKEGKRLGAFRFKTPEAKGNWDMDWEFVIPQGALQQWYILPREGTMASGFRTLKSEKDYQEKGTALPEKNLRVLQPLTGGLLKPGQEYIIWFTFAKDDPVEMHVRIGVSEAPVVKKN
jgi:hypothetical protein